MTDHEAAHVLRVVRQFYNINPKVNPVADTVYAVIWGVVIVGGIVMLAACSTTTASDYDRGSAPTGQFDRDTAACEQAGDEHRSVDVALWGGPVSYNRLFDECMRSKGYVRKT